MMVFRQLLLFVLVFLVSFLSVSVADDDCLNYYDAVFKNMLEDTNTFGEFYEVAYDALLEAGAVDSAELNTFSDLNANPTTPIAEIPDNILHSLRAIVGGLCDVHPTRVLSDLSDVFPERYAEPYDLSGLYDALPSAEDRATFSLPLTADTGNCVTVDTNVGTHSRVMNCTGYLEESLVGTFIISYSFFSNVLSEFVDCPNDLVLSLTYTGNLNNRGWTCEEPLIYEPLETTHGDCEFTTSEYVHDIGFAEFERRVNCDGYNGDDLVGTHELIPITNFHAHLSSHISCVGDGEQSFAVVRGSRIGWVCSSDDISCEYGMYYDENLDECVLIDEPEDDVDDTADFYERDGTIYCYNAEIGDTGVVNGVTYTAYDNPGLYAVQTNASALETACTSHVTSFNPSNSISTGGLFYDSTNNFQPNISHWDTSKVTNMRGMFHTSQFNGDISNWNVSSVTNMGYMFYNAQSFNQPLYSWDVSSVIDMAWIFSSAHSFNQYIGDWDVSKVTNMGGMFRDASNFNQPIGSWDVSSVTNMAWIFSSAHSFNQYIGDWDVSKVTNMGSMFWGAISFNQDLSGWCVRNIDSKPSGFDINANSWLGGDATRPQWGTCPARTDLTDSCSDSTECADGESCEEGVCVATTTTYRLSINSQAPHGEIVVKKNQNIFARIWTFITGSDTTFTCDSRTCYFDFDAGTSLTLSATPDDNVHFLGFEGDCSGLDDCSFDMDADKSVSVSFQLLCDVDDDCDVGESCEEGVCTISDTFHFDEYLSCDDERLDDIVCNSDAEFDTVKFSFQRGIGRIVDSDTGVIYCDTGCSRERYRCECDVDDILGDASFKILNLTVIPYEGSTPDYISGYHRINPEVCNEGTHCSFSINRSLRSGSWYADVMIFTDLSDERKQYFDDKSSRQCQPAGSSEDVNILGSIDEFNYRDFVNPSFFCSSSNVIRVCILDPTYIFPRKTDSKLTGRRVDFTDVHVNHEGCEGMWVDYDFDQLYLSIPSNVSLDFRFRYKGLQSSSLSFPPYYPFRLDLPQYNPRTFGSSWYPVYVIGGQKYTLSFAPAFLVNLPDYTSRYDYPLLSHYDLLTNVNLISGNLTRGDYSFTGSSNNLVMFYFALEKQLLKDGVVEWYCNPPDDLLGHEMDLIEDYPVCSFQFGGLDNYCSGDPPLNSNTYIDEDFTGEIVSWRYHPELDPSREDSPRWPCQFNCPDDLPVVDFSQNACVEGELHEIPQDFVELYHRPPHSEIQGKFYGGTCDVGEVYLSFHQNYVHTPRSYNPQLHLDRAFDTLGFYDIHAIFNFEKMVGDNFCRPLTICGTATIPGSYAKSSYRYGNEILRESSNKFCHHPPPISMCVNPAELFKRDVSFHDLGYGKPNHLTSGEKKYSYVSYSGDRSCNDGFVWVKWLGDKHFALPQGFVFSDGEKDFTLKDPIAIQSSSGFEYIYNGRQATPYPVEWMCGDFSPSREDICSLPLSDDGSSNTVTLTVETQGPRGSVTVPGTNINCNSNHPNNPNIICEGDFEVGYSVTLRANAVGSDTHQWIEGCTGAGDSCDLTLNGDMYVVVKFSEKTCPPGEVLINGQCVIDCSDVTFFSHSWDDNDPTNVLDGINYTQGSSPGLFYSDHLGQWTRNYRDYKYDQNCNIRQAFRTVVCDNAHHSCTARSGTQRFDGSEWVWHGDYTYCVPPVSASDSDCGLEVPACFLQNSFDLSSTGPAIYSPVDDRWYHSHTKGSEGKDYTRQYYDFKDRVHVYMNRPACSSSGNHISYWRHVNCGGSASEYPNQKGWQYWSGSGWEWHTGGGNPKSCEG